MANYLLCIVIETNLISSSHGKCSTPIYILTNITYGIEGVIALEWLVGAIHNTVYLWFLLALS